MKKYFFAILLSLPLLFIFFKTDSIFAQYGTSACSSGYYCEGGTVYYTKKTCVYNWSVGMCETQEETKSLNCTSSACQIGDYSHVCTTLSYPCEWEREVDGVGCCEKCGSGCGDCSSGTYYASNPGGNYVVSGSRTCYRDDCSSYSQDCYSCSPSSGCSCGDLATSNQGYGSKNESCGDGCGGTTSSTCYCKTQCSSGDPLTCPTNSSSTPQGTGNFTVSCSNDCQTSTKTCYCPAADCSDYDDGTGIPWYDTCPSGSCRSTSLNVPIPDTPHSNCATSRTKTCFTTNVRSTNLDVEVVHTSQLVSLRLFPNSNLLSKLIHKIRAANLGDDEILGFNSSSHSGKGLLVSQGGGLNNPIGLHAEFRDSDGQDDIVALYIWWSPQTNKSNITTPTKLDNSKPAQSESKDSWGFLVTRNSIGGAWNRVYAPHISGSDVVWTHVGNVSDDTVNIKGPSRVNMVQLSNINPRNSGTATDIHLDLQMKFLLNSPDIVATDQYNLFALANDYVGFTNFMTDNNIKEAGDSFWRDSAEDWNLDMQSPEVVNITTSDTSGGQVTVTSSLTDNDRIAYVRLDACKTGLDAPNTLSTSHNSSYNLKFCSDFDALALDMEAANSLIGSQGGPLNTNSFNINEVVTLGSNAEGAITYYVTVIDHAGNFHQDFTIYRLEQWAMVRDGLVFGREGVTSSSRLVEDPLWNGHSVLESFVEEQADLTNQVLLGGTSSMTALLRKLERYQVNNSFKIARYPGMLMNSPYSELMNAYAARDQDLFEKPSMSGVTNISGSMSTLCTDSSKYCILNKTDGSLLINNFTCDGKGLIAASGDITIRPNLTNPSATDACIILSGGNISIQQGSDASEATHTVAYDKIHAYIIANGTIQIETDANEDALFIEGGLAGFTPMGVGGAAVSNNREVNFSDMGIYPVLLIENNAKYGFLSKDVFGTQIEIFKNEIGFKPY